MSIDAFPVATYYPLTPKIIENYFSNLEEEIAGKSPETVTGEGVPGTPIDRVVSLMLSARSARPDGPYQGEIVRKLSFRPTEECVAPNAKKTSPLPLTPLKTVLETLANQKLGHVVSYVEGGGVQTAAMMAVYDHETCFRTEGALLDGKHAAVVMHYAGDREACLRTDSTPRDSKGAVDEALVVCVGAGAVKEVVASSLSTGIANGGAGHEESTSISKLVSVSTAGGVSPSLFSAKTQRFFAELNTTDLSKQIFFQDLYDALLAKGIGCMTEAELWQELLVLYELAKRDVFGLIEMTPRLYTHTEFPQLPRTFMLWVDDGRVYATIFFNRHKIPQETGEKMKGDPKFPIPMKPREKKFVYGLHFALHEFDIQKVVVISYPIKEKKLSEYERYRLLPKLPYIVRMYMGIRKTSKTKKPKAVHVMPIYEKGDFFGRVERLYDAKKNYTLLVTLAFRQLAYVLARMHDANVVHRDIKCENIFIDKEDEENVEFALADFEFADRVASVSTSEGTSVYFSPALVRYKEKPLAEPLPDYKAADVWALGVTALSAYSMINLFYGVDLTKISQAEIDKKVNQCWIENKYVVAVDRRIKQIIKDMLVLEDDKRITMREVCSRLEKIG